MSLQPNEFDVNRVVRSHREKFVLTLQIPVETRDETIQPCEHLDLDLDLDLRSVRWRQ